MSSIKATVVIPTKNGGPLFKKVLDRILNQKTEWSFSVLVIDSGSSDGSLEWARAQADKVNILRVQSIPPNEFGHGKTRNLGANGSESEFIVFVTQDALPVNGNWLHLLVSICETDEKIAGSFGRHLPYPDCDALVARDINRHFDELAKYPVIGLSDPVRYQNDISYRQLLHFFSDNNSCLRRSVWEKIPYPNVNFAEDQAWAKSVVEAGYLKAYADDASVYHSHQYDLVETLRRSFDESRALRSLFGYVLQGSFFRMLGSAAKKTLNDWLYLAGSGKKDVLYFLRVPFYNLMKNSGIYLGSKKLPISIEDKISLDQGLKRGRVK